MEEEKAIPSDLLHNLTYERGLLAEGPFTTRNLRFRIPESDSVVAFVLPVGETCNPSVNGSKSCRVKCI